MILKREREKKKTKNLRIRDIFARGKRDNTDPTIERSYSDLVFAAHFTLESETSGSKSGLKRGH